MPAAAPNSDLSGLNYLYLGYTLWALALTAILVRRSIRDHQARPLGLFLFLSRLGTLTLTVGTFVDNLRTFLTSYPEVAWPEEVQSAGGNLTVANAAWAAIDYGGATLQVACFNIGNWTHILFASLAIFNIGQLYTVSQGPGRKLPEMASRRVLLVTALAVVAVSTVQVLALVLGPLTGPYKLKQAIGLYRVTAAVHPPAWTGFGFPGGLLAVVGYTLAMIVLGVYMSCKASSPAKRKRHIAFTCITAVAMVMNAVSADQERVLSVIGNLGEQMQFSALMWQDFWLNGDPDDDDDDAWYSESFGIEYSQI